MFIHKRKIYGFLCDIYGHLNNSSYLQLYEEARAEALSEMDLPIIKLLEYDLQIYIIKVEISYKKGVPNDEAITIRSSIIRLNRMRSTWKQEILNQNGELCSEAIIEGVFVKNGKPIRIDKDLLRVFEQFSDK